MDRATVKPQFSHRLCTFALRLGNPGQKVHLPTAWETGVFFAENDSYWPLKVTQKGNGNDSSTDHVPVGVLW